MSKYHILLYQLLLTFSLCLFASGPKWNTPGPNQNSMKTFENSDKFWLFKILAFIIWCKWIVLMKILLKPEMDENSMNFNLT